MELIRAEWAAKVARWRRLLAGNTSRAELARVEGISRAAVSKALGG